jgi:uncharacterized protein (TIGR02001 family)
MRARAFAAIMGFALLAQNLRAGETWGGSVGVTTDYILHGVSQSAGEPAIQADIHFRAPSGWRIGAWASNIQFDASLPRGVEIDAYVGFDKPLGTHWNTDFTITHYAYPWTTPAGFYEYDELAGALSYEDRGSLRLAYSPNATAVSTYGIATHRRAFSAELSLRQYLVAHAALAGGLGYYDLSDGVGRGYAYWSLGLNFDRGRLHADLTYFGTDSTGSRLYFNDAASNHWAGTILWRF